MKVLYVTDTHLTAKNPASRLDVYETVTYEKLDEIGRIIKENNVDLVIHGGDMFHSAKVSLKYTGKIAKKIISWGVKVLVDIGNHDTYGYNTETIDQTTLGLLDKTNIIELLSRNNPKIYDIDGLSLVIEGQEYHKDMDNNKDVNDYRVDINGDYNVLVVHGMLLDKPFFPGIPHTVISDVKTNADLVLSGHYHPGYKEVTIGKTTFINPGSAMRVESDRQDMPKVVIFDFKNVDDHIEQTHEYVYLKSAKPREEIFDFEKILKRNNKFALISEFQKSIEDLTNLQTKTSAIDIVLELAKVENIDSRIINNTINLITNAEELADDENDVLKGYVEKPYELCISQVELVNFQSHSHSIINFTDGLNAIIGESGQGKTSILVGIYWCLFNEPKGDEFIRTGQKSCSVKITFNDGSSILRQRSRTSSGYYEVTDIDGEVKVFKGFGSEIPIEVYNEHQMINVTLAKGKKSKINIKSQFDPPFLLSEPVSVKASALGRLIGAQTMDIAIRDCSKNVLDYSKKMTLYSNLIKDEEEKLKALTELEDKKILLSKVEDGIKNLEDLKNTLALKQEFSKELNKLMFEIEELNYEKNTIANIYELSKLNNLFEVNLENLYKLYENKELVNELDKLNNSISIDNEELRKIKSILPKLDLTSLQDKVNEYVKIIGLGENLIDVNKQINNLENEVIYDSLIKEFDLSLMSLDDLTNKFYNLNNYRDSLEVINQNIIEDKLELEKISDRLDKGKDLINNTKNDFKSYLDKIEVCPICNQVINSKFVIDEEE